MKERRAVTIWGNWMATKNIKAVDVQVGGSIWLIVSIENPGLSQLCIESAKKKP